MRATEAAREPAAKGGQGYGAVASRKPRTIPHISIHAFCEDRKTVEALQTAAADRRMANAQTDVSVGGLEAALARCIASPGPDLVVVETTQSGAQVLAALDRLAECCNPATKVMVIGQVNDIALYRELLKRGVGEYLIAPVSPLDFIESVANLHGGSGAGSVGSIIAFLGAKGGVGSSTVCHNVAWAMSETLKSDVVVVDLDLAFGTAALDFNQEPMRGIAEALQAPERLHDVSLDRLLTRCSQHLSILAAPGALDREYDASGDACDVVLEALRQDIPYVAVDLPHAWTPSVKRVLLLADEIVLTAAPDLANVRNAKDLIDLLKSTRRDGMRPHLVINTARMPKRPEISVKQFSADLDLDPTQVIEFDSETFGYAANNGQMIEEFSRTAKAARQFRALALTLAHRAEPTQAKRPSPLAPILEKLRLPLLVRRLKPFSTA